MKIPTTMKTLFAKIATPKIAGYLGIALLAFALAWWIHPSPPSEMETWREGYAAYQKQTTELLAQSAQQQVVIDSLEKASKAANRRASASEAKANQLEQTRPSPAVIQTLREQIDSLKQSSDSVELARTVIPVQQELIDSLTSTVQTDSLIKVELRRTVFDLRTANTKLTSSNLLITADRDRLQRQLINLPDAPPEEKFLWVFPMPSRTAAFGIGAAMGVGATLWVVK